MVFFLCVCRFLINILFPFSIFPEQLCHTICVNLFLSFKPTGGLLITRAGYVKLLIIRIFEILYNPTKVLYKKRTVNCLYTIAR